MLVYLASPYSPVGKYTEKEAALVREKRFIEICKVTGALMENGVKAFSPIAHSHPIEVYGLNPPIKLGDWWLDFDFEVLRHCEELWVYMMNGWEKSYGVRREMRYAREHGIPVFYLRQGDLVPFARYDSKRGYYNPVPLDRQAA